MTLKMSGNGKAVQSRSMYLVELALDMCHQVLRKDGGFTVSVFRGAGFDEYFRAMKAAFKVVKTRKRNS